MRTILSLILFLLFLTDANANIKSDTTFVATAAKNSAYILDGTLEAYSSNDGYLIKYDENSKKFSLFNTKNDPKREVNRIDKEATKAEKLIKFIANKASSDIFDKFDGLSKYKCNDIELFRILTEKKRKDTAYETLTKETKLCAGTLYTRETKGEFKCTYHLYVPTSYKANSSKTMPLIVAFSPGGDGQGIMRNIKLAAERHDSFLIGCDYLRNGISSYELEVKVEDEIMEDIFELLDFDQEKLIYAGFSGGGMRSFGLSERRKEKVLGVISMGGWLGGPDYQDKNYPKDMRVAMLNGNKDRAANGWQPIDTKTLVKCGSTVKSFPFTGSHQAAPELIVDNALAWILFNDK